LKEAFSKLASPYFLPLSIFSTRLTPLQSLCKYLKDNEGLRFSDIARLLRRDQRNIRAAYVKAKKKHPRSYQPIEEKCYIPISICRHELSLQEAIVGYLLLVKRWDVRSTAKALKRSEKTIYTIKYQLRDKMEGGSP
jgi:hypothetical protein